MDFMTITKPQLMAAMLRWEQDARNGRGLTHDEAEVLAEVGTNRLWEDLAAVAAAESLPALGG